MLAINDGVMAKVEMGKDIVKVTILHFSNRQKKEGMKLNGLPGNGAQYFWLLTKGDL